MTRMDPEQLRQFAAESEAIRQEASRTSVRSAVLEHLRRAASAVPEHRLRGGWTPEEVTDKLVGAMNAMLNSSPPTDRPFPHGLQAHIRRIIASQEMDSEQALRYVALVGVLLEEMTGEARWADPGQGREAFGKKFQARLDKYADLPLTEQINRLAGEAQSSLKPALTRACCMNLLQIALKQLGESGEGYALSEIAEACADRENALILAAMHYARDAADPKVFPTHLEPAVYLRAAAYELNVTRACAMELSGLMKKSEALDVISQEQEETCAMLAFLSWLLFSAGGAVLSLEASGTICAQLGLLCLEPYVALAGVVLFVALGIAVAAGVDAAASEIVKTLNTRRHIRSLDAETQPPEEEDEAYGWSGLSDDEWEDGETDILFLLD